MPRAAIGIGTNLGDRLGNILAALRALGELNVQVCQLSRLYESAAAYVTDQPPFLNAAALVDTPLRPLELLGALKQVEAQLGRDFGGIRYGPRPIDLDIIFYEGETVEEQPGDKLLVPHPRWRERGFVQAPLADLWPPACPAAAGGGAAAAERSGDDGGGASGYSSGSESSGGVVAGDAGAWGGGGGLEGRLQQARQLWETAGGERQLGGPELECVVPLGGPLGPQLGLWRWQRRAQVMGIINVTPDSFSDGGRHFGCEEAVEAGRRMVAEGADVLDVGGQSTRPGSQLLSPQEEAERVLPVIRALAEDDATRGTPISVDTFYAEVAQRAVHAGAAIVNDVSGGTLDEDMLPTVAKLGVPYILMHLRGTPQTMQSAEHTTYTDVCAEVAAALQAQGERAMAAGIEPWRLILDPGLGFAKTVEGNVALMAGLGKVRSHLAPPLRMLPMLLGPSRKGFLGKLTGRKSAAERDHATSAAAALCVSQGANIIRAHNVAAVRDAVRVADAFCMLRQH